MTQEEFEAMRRRYAGELMAIRRSVDAILDQNGLLENFSLIVSSWAGG